MQQRQNRRHGLALKDFWNKVWHLNSGKTTSPLPMEQGMRLQRAENQEQSQGAGGIDTALITPLHALSDSRVLL